MKQEPLMKREVAVEFYYEPIRHINFYATADAATEFEQYGTLLPDPNRRDGYRLEVDARYDFGEVLAYIQNYG